MGKKKKKDAAEARVAIAIDGRESAGAREIARLVAAELGWRHVCPDAIARAVALFLTDDGALPSEPWTIEESSRRTERRNAARGGAAGKPAGWLEATGTRIEGERVFFGDEEVTGRIWTAEAAVARDAFMADWRASSIVREITSRLVGEGDCVAEYADGMYGTSTERDFDLKIFLDAGAQERAARRWAAARAAGKPKGYARAFEEIERKDALDAKRRARTFEKERDAIATRTDGTDDAAVASKVASLARLVASLKKGTLEVGAGDADVAREVAYRTYLARRRRLEGDAAERFANAPNGYLDRDYAAGLFGAWNPPEKTLAELAKAYENDPLVVETARRREAGGRAAKAGGAGAPKTLLDLASAMTYESRGEARDEKTGAAFSVRWLPPEDERNVHERALAAIYAGIEAGKGKGVFRASEFEARATPRFKAALRKAAGREWDDDVDRASSLAYGLEREFDGYEKFAAELEKELEDEFRLDKFAAELEKGLCDGE